MKIYVNKEMRFNLAFVRLKERLSKFSINIIFIDYNDRKRKKYELAIRKNEKMGELPK